MPLSPADSAALATAGNNFTGFFATLAFQTFFYGIYAVLIIVSIIVHLRKESMTRATLIMFVVTLAMFTSTTVYYGSSTAAMVKQLRTVLVDQSRPDVKLRLASLADMKIGYNITENWISAINFTISDIVVVWRAWALSRGNRKIMIPSLVLMVLTIISACIFAGYSCVTGNPATSPVMWATIWAADQLALETLSLATNISATAVISYKAWSHRRMAIASQKYHSITFGAENVLMLLVESGIVYCMLQAILVILTYLFRFSPNDPAAANIIRSALGGYFGTFLVFSGIYPTAIVLLVAMQRSISESRMWRSTEVPLVGTAGSSWSGSRSTGTTNTGVTVTTEKWSTGMGALQANHNYSFTNSTHSSSSSLDLEKQQPLPLRTENGRTYF